MEKNTTIVTPCSNSECPYCKGTGIIKADCTTTGHEAYYQCHSNGSMTEIPGATAYATKLHQVEQENIQLNRWKAAQIALFEPLYDYGMASKEIRLGESIVTFILNRCKEYDKMKQQAQPGARWPLFVIDKATGERHQVNKVVYHPENEPEPHVWCDTWYGHHVIGNDCEWADEQSNDARWVKCSDRLPEISKPPKLLTVKRYESNSEIYSTMAVTAAQLADIVKCDLANFEWLDEQPAAESEIDRPQIMRHAIAFANWLLPSGCVANEKDYQLLLMKPEALLDEHPAAGSEEEAVEFLTWIQKNDYYYNTHDGGYWYEWDEKEQETFLCDTNAQLYELFKQQHNP